MLSKMDWELLISLLKKLFILWPVRVLPCTLYCQVPVSHLDNVFDAQLNCNLFQFVFRCMVKNMLTNLKPIIKQKWEFEICKIPVSLLVMKVLVRFLSDISSEKKNVLRMNIIKFNIIYCYALIMYLSVESSLVWAFLLSCL